LRESKKRVPLQMMNKVDRRLY